MTESLSGYKPPDNFPTSNELGPVKTALYFAAMNVIAGATQQQLHNLSDPLNLLWILGYPAAAGAGYLTVKSAVHNLWYGYHQRLQEKYDIVKSHASTSVRSTSAARTEPKSRRDFLKAFGTIAGIGALFGIPLLHSKKNTSTSSATTERLPTLSPQVLELSQARYQDFFPFQEATWYQHPWGNEKMRYTKDEFTRLSQYMSYAEACAHSSGLDQLFGKYGKVAHFVLGAMIWQESRADNNAYDARGNSWGIAGITENYFPGYTNADLRNPAVSIYLMCEVIKEKVNHEIFFYQKYLQNKGITMQTSEILQNIQQHIPLERIIQAYNGRYYNTQQPFQDEWNPYGELIIDLANLMLSDNTKFHFTTVPTSENLVLTN